MKSRKAVIRLSPCLYKGFSKREQNDFRLHDTRQEMPGDASDEIAQLCPDKIIFIMIISGWMDTEGVQGMAYFLQN